MTNDNGRILTVRTTNIRTAAVLMSKGFPLQGGEESERPGIVNFMVMVPEKDKEKAQQLVVLCKNGLDLDIHLGTYERNLRSVLKLISRFKELENNGARTDKEAART